MQIYHYDGLGSTRLLTDVNGNTTDAYQYEAFGDLLSQTGFSENNYLFTGEQYDEELGQYYLRARYYDQTSGRFTGMDEWDGKPFKPQTLNKYSYAHSSPSNGYDPSGYAFLAGFSVNTNIRGTLAARASTNYTKLYSKALWGEVKEHVAGEVTAQVFGAIGNEVVNRMIKAVDNTAFHGQSASSFGSTAHKKLKDLIEEDLRTINKKLRKFNVRVDAEVFRLDGGEATQGKKREKGSMGLDVDVISTVSGDVLLAFDLKTGKSGTTNKKLPGYRKRINNAPIIDIFIRRTK